MSKTQSRNVSRLARPMLNLYVAEDTRSAWPKQMVFVMELFHEQGGCPRHMPVSTGRLVERTWDVDLTRASRSAIKSEVPRI
jgi:hypothetical protein